MVSVDLFAAIPLVDYERALAWYERLLGSGPSFVPNAVFRAARTPKIRSNPRREKRR
jgi:hypothetical protein